MNVIVVKDYEALSKKAASLIQSHLSWQPDAVLGLATGSTPIGTYKALIDLYQQGEIDFSQVTTFNLDEYLGLDKSNEQSYDYFMKHQFFNHVNVREEAIHMPDGMSEDHEAACVSYEKSIVAHGGIDLQLLGIGHNGHIGFNEPNEEFEAKTHIVNLDQKTIEANKRFFDSVDDVPKQAISMGIKTIMRSKNILLLASGEDKADIIAKLVNNDITPDLPASVLHLHEHVIILVDEAAASKL